MIIRPRESKEVLSVSSLVHFPMTQISWLLFPMSHISWDNWHWECVLFPKDSHTFNPCGCGLPVVSNKITMVHIKIVQLLYRRYTWLEEGCFLIYNLCKFCNKIAPLSLINIYWTLGYSVLICHTRWHQRYRPGCTMPSRDSFFSKDCNVREKPFFVHGLSCFCELNSLFP